MAAIIQASLPGLQFYSPPHSVEGRTSSHLFDLGIFYAKDKMKNENVTKAIML